MEKGIFSKVFTEYPLLQAFEKIQNYGFQATQFNFSNVGLHSLPNEINDEVIAEIYKVSNITNVSIPVVSGTFNTLELNKEKRKNNLKRFNNIAEAAKKLRIPYISISTGSFNQEDFWSPHPDNHTKKAWDYLMASLDEMLEIAVKNEITIVVEPEQANVISSVEDTIKLLNYYDIPNLKVLFDAANIVTNEDVNNLEKKISNSLKYLGPYIAMAHCKDCIVTEEEIQFAPVGRGNLPLNHYVKELKKYYNGPVIMHGLNEEHINYALKNVSF